MAGKEIVRALEGWYISTSRTECADMYGPREILAAVLTFAIGLALIVAPNTVARLQFFAHGPTTGRHGEYGDDRVLTEKQAWIARAIGLVPIAVAGYILAVPVL